MPVPSEWGPHMWALLHDLALKVDAVAKLANTKTNTAQGAAIQAAAIKATPEISMALQNLFDSLQFCLPCFMCRQHYSKFIKDKNLTAMFKPEKVKAAKADKGLYTSHFVFQLHNHANKETNKKEYSWRDFLKNPQVANWVTYNQVSSGVTLEQIAFLFKEMFSDEICDTNSKAAEVQRKQVSYHFPMSFFALPENQQDMFKSCIALIQLKRFASSLSTLYGIFALLFDPVSSAAGRVVGPNENIVAYLNKIIPSLG